MITREQYLNALEVIDQYHYQENETQNVNNGKTPVREWEYINTCSTRLRNVLLGVHRCKNDYCGEEIKYIEDITRHNFFLQRKSGHVTWKEFCFLTGRNELV